MSEVIPFWYSRVGFLHSLQAVTVRGHTSIIFERMKGMRSEKLLGFGISQFTELFKNPWLPW